MLSSDDKLKFVFFFDVKWCKLFNSLKTNFHQTKYKLSRKDPAGLLTFHHHPQTSDEELQEPRLYPENQSFWGIQQAN